MRSVLMAYLNSAQAATGGLSVSDATVYMDPRITKQRRLAWINVGLTWPPYHDHMGEPKNWYDMPATHLAASIQGHIRRKNKWKRPTVAGVVYNMGTGRLRALVTCNEFDEVLEGMDPPYLEL